MITVIPLGSTAEPVARHLAGAGGAVVIVADEGTAAEAGRLAGEIESDGHARPAVFALREDTEEAIAALAAFVAELFPPA